MLGLYGAVPYEHNTHGYHSMYKTSKTRVYDPVAEPDPTQLIHLSDNLEARRRALGASASQPTQTMPARRAESEDIFGENFVSLNNFNTVTLAHTHASLLRSRIRLSVLSPW